jgi:hypothetical protein
MIAGEPEGAHLTVWFAEPEEPEAVCRCIRTGDFEETRWCPEHSKTREPAVKLAGCGEGYDSVPF